MAEKWKDNVLLVDANLTSPNLSMYLGELDPELTLHGVVDGEYPIEDSIKKLGGMDVIYGSARFGEISHRIDIDSYLRPLRREYKFIFIDTAPSLGNETISAMKACDEIITVTNPDYPSIVSNLQTFRSAEKYELPIIGTVINRVYNRDYEIPAKDIKKGLGWPILAIIPDDEKIRESTAMGMPVIEHDSDSPASRKIRKLAEKIEKHIKD